MAGITTGVGPLDRVHRPRDRQGRLDGRVLGQQARPRRRSTPRSTRPAAASRASSSSRWSQTGRSIREMAAELGVSSATVRHWLKKHGLRTRPRALLAARRAEAGGARARVPAAWLDDLRADRSHALSLRPLQRRVRRHPAKEDQGDPGPRSRWPLPALRVRQVHRRAPLPPRRSGLESLLVEPRWGHPLAPPSTRRGREMRATVRELPRNGGGGIDRSRRACRSCG